ncbi:MAG: deoxyhypusine synthase [Rubritalea sp.]|jgi:deoxyhypusine synthase|tara:strand:+ start:273 stop:629 length:357 start_codon:yes stop_codon:yes gene_type:complete
MFLFSGCQSETKEASKASLESAVTELESLIDSKNTYAVTKMIISPSNLSAAGSLELAERIVKIRANDLFTYSEANISGDIVAVVLMIDAYSMETAILAKWEDQQWIFFYGDSCLFERI